jgi:hypothetical protein
MQMMKKYIALIVTSAAALCHAQAVPAGVRAPDLRQVSVQKSAPPASIAPRQLSALERAELRRQLSEYSRSTHRGS